MADLRKIKDKAAETAAKGKLDKAARLYREAIEEDPNDIATLQKLAEVLRRAGRIDEAIETYREVADRFGRDGLLMKAIAISKTILELDPDHVDTQSALADLYGRKAAAEKSRPPVRGTLMMAAVSAPGSASGAGAIVPPPPSPAPPFPDEDGIVSIPLSSAPPPGPAAVPPPLPVRGRDPFGVPSPDPFAVPGPDPFAAAGPDPFAFAPEDLSGGSGAESAGEAGTAGAGESLDMVVDEASQAPPSYQPPRGTPATALEQIVEAADAAIDAGVEEQFAFEPEALEAGGPDEPLDPYVPPVAAPAPPPVQPPPRAVSAPAMDRAPAKPLTELPGTVARTPEAPAGLDPSRKAQQPAPALPRVPIFSDLSPEAFVALARGMVLHRMSAGDAVIREGETGTSFYVVATGRLAVTKRDDQGAQLVLGRLGEGSFFGEMAMLSGTPRSATVTAEDACEVLELRADVLAELAGRHPHVAASLRRFYRQRLLANAMAVSPIFRPFERGDRKLIMERFRAREVAVGEVVIREGEPSDGLYVVMEGAVDVMKRTAGGETAVGHLREGDVFGEMSCLRKAPASASVVVARAGTLLRLPRKDFDWLVVTYPQVLQHVSELAEERLENLDAILSGRAQWTEDGLVLV